MLAALSFLVLLAVFKTLHAQTAIGCQAYAAECQRQMRKLKHEIEIAKASTDAGDDLVASAEAFLREMAAEEK